MIGSRTIQLKAAISEFDGKHTDSLERVAEQLEPDATTIRRLCKLAELGEPKFPVATTWLLKHFCEQGHTYTRTQADRMMGLLSVVKPWEAKLHLLQIVPNLEIPEARRFDLRGVILRLVDHDNKLLRAWSYNAMVVLATQFPEFENEARDLLHAGEKDPAASVRARLRNVRKGCDFLK